MGLLVLVVGLLGLTVGLLQHLKAKRIIAAPFRKTGELAKNPTSPDPKGLMSTEGRVVSATPLLSPCSQTPCLYYEVELIRHGEKTEVTQEGTKTEKTKQTVETLRKGQLFSLDDGSGPVSVDTAHGGDFDNLQKKFEEKVKLGMMLPGELRFGKLTVRTPSLPSGESTLAFEAVEKLVPAEGSLFALGKIDNGVLGKPGWRSMMFSSKGREGLLASTAKLRKVGLIVGGLATAAAIPLMIFAPAAPPPATCAAQLAGAVERCPDTLTDTQRRYEWSVDAAGEYELVVTAPSDKAFALAPQLTVQDGAGAELATATGPGGGSATLRQRFEPGKYALVLQDASGVKVKGGFDYTLAIARTDPAAAVAAAPAPANAAVCEEEEALTDARTCKVKILALGTTFVWNVSAAGPYTLTLMPFGSKTVRQPVLMLDGDERKEKGTVTAVRKVEAGPHTLSLLEGDPGVQASDFPLEATLAIVASPAPGKRVAQEKKRRR